MFRLMRLRKGPIIAALYPIFALLVQLAVAVLAGLALSRGLDWLLPGPLGRVAGILAGLGLAGLILRWFKRKDGKVWLLPHNAAFSPIDGDHATILGKVTAVLRRV